MASDGYVQGAPDSTGKKVDTSEQTRDDGTVVERQRVALADPLDLTGLARVEGEIGRGALAVSDRHLALLESIDDKLTLLVELIGGALE